MRAEFERYLREVQVREGVRVLMGQVGLVLGILGGIGVLGVLVERILGVGVFSDEVKWGLGGAVVAAIVILWWYRRPGRMEAALLLDERLGTKERFSTALALADSENAFARAAVTEAREAAKRLNLSGAFRVRPGRVWLGTAGVWVLAAGLVLWLPVLDVLGRLKEREQQQEDARQLAQVQVEVATATKNIEAMVKQLGETDLAKELGDIGDMSGPLTAQEMRREAIRKLGEVADRLGQKYTGEQLASGEMLQKMLRQLHGVSGGVLPELSRALAKGDFSKAAEMMREAQKQLREGQYSEQQRKELERQLRELGEQLAKLAAENRELQKELERLGLDKKLAELDAEALRKALEKAGLSEEKIKELLEKAAACRQACRACSGLAAAMASCGAGGGGVSAEGIGQMVAQLDELEALQQQLAMMQASLAEINNTIGCLGEGQCQGLGLCQGVGISDKPQKGIGLTPGPWTESPDVEGAEATQATRVESTTKNGPMIASWVFKGEQVKGQSQREAVAVMQAAKERAAEAISEKEIPRKYEEAVKGYFGAMREEE